VRRKTKERGELWAHEIDKDFRMTEWSSACPMQKSSQWLSGIKIGRVGVRAVMENVQPAPPSQAAILVLDNRIGSFAIISIGHAEDHSVILKSLSISCAHNSPRSFVFLLTQPYRINPAPTLARKHTSPGHP